MKRLDDGLKQRVIGAVILLALAVIFIPVLFDKDRIEPIDRKTQIPPPPEIRPVVIPDPVPLKNIDRAPDPDDMFVPEETAAPVVEKTELVAENKEAEPSRRRSDGTPKSWILQIASLRSEVSAIELRDKLIKAGYSAYLRQSNYKNGTVHRVFVGPKLEKAALLKEKRAIDRAYKVDSLLLEFKAKP